MKISFISTVYNEEKNIDQFVTSILNQTVLPDEIIIVDGGSTDRTVECIQRRKPEFKGRFEIIVNRGNRSVGRNIAIKNALNSIIVCSDAGCILDNNWIKNITEYFNYSNVNVVAGYYSAKTKSIFQKCLVPYVLVMPDKLNESTFLPSARSMAFEKKIWQKVGGFNKYLSNNEDYEFAKRLEEEGITIKFAKNAVVYWIPRDNFKQAFYMFYRFALGDAESNILRSKVILIYLRYLLAFFIFISFLMTKSEKILIFIIVLLFLYLLWSVQKNFKYVCDIKAFIYLPFLQLISDIAILIGTTAGIIRYRWVIQKIR